jgi:hypothetical protein
MKIFLNRIHEFETYTVNSLKRERGRGEEERKKKKNRRERGGKGEGVGGGEEEKEVEGRGGEEGGGGTIVTTLSERGKGNNVQVYTLFFKITTAAFTA